jgi:ribosome-associated toxin RatA of RatAB toxin-antitoxin module
MGAAVFGDGHAGSGGGGWRQYNFGIVKHVKKSVLLWYSPHEMYALVTAVQDYPSFLPWCERAEVLAQDEGGVTARLHLSYRGVRQAFTTRNVHVPDASVVLSLVDGPFSELAGTWGFVPVPAGSASQAKACKIEFDLRYSFANGALDALISPVFDRVANTFVESFVKRAEQVYGER